MLQSYSVVLVELHCSELQHKKQRHQGILALGAVLPLGSLCFSLGPVLEDDRDARALAHGHVIDYSLLYLLIIMTRLLLSGRT